MKYILIVVLFTVASSNVFALDLKGKLIEAAKDKKNQEQAKEFAKKGIEYFQGDKKEEAKVEATPAAAPTPAPVVEKAATKKSKNKKTVKKKAS